MSKLVAKLERPPYAHNFVRYIFPDVPTTTSALVNFAIGRPPYTYATGNRLASDRVLLGLDRETALHAAKTRGHKKSRHLNVEYLNAFYDYDETRGLSRTPSFDQVVEPFRVSRSVAVPVKPLAVCSERGRLQAVFSVGWASVPLIRSQWRLLLTMMEDAVFTLTDFEMAHGEFCAFPRENRADPESRNPLIVNRGDYELLSNTELVEQLEVYLEALDAAKAILAGMESPAEKTTPEQSRDLSQLSLF